MVIEDIVRSWASRMLAVMLAAALALVLAVFLLPAPAVSAQSRRSPGAAEVSPQPNGCWWFEECTADCGSCGGCAPNWKICVIRCRPVDPCGGYVGDWTNRSLYCEFYGGSVTSNGH